MDIHVGLVLVVCAALWAATGEVRRAGWLDRLVHHFKNNFLEDLRQLAPINIQASIERAPSGYVDSTAWDYDSVTRLLGLLRASETARPVSRALRRMLAPPSSRRFMSRQKSYKFFPSLTKMHTSNLYYDMDTDEDYASGSEEEEPSGPAPAHAVVVVRNPVEARLPSARISVGLLKEILEARAIAARKMPPTKTTAGWVWTTKVKNVTKGPATSEAPAVQDSTALEPDQGEVNSTTPTEESQGKTTTPANEAENKSTTTESQSEAQNVSNNTESENVSNNTESENVSNNTENQNESNNTESQNSTINN